MREAELPFFNKLSFKFSMYLVAIILILMTLFTIYLVNDFAADEADIYQENFKRNLELLANTSSNYLWDFEFKDLKENAEYFFQEEELVQIIIKDGKGEKLVELRSPAIKKGKLLKASQKIYYSNDKFLGEVEITYTDYFYKIRVAVLRNRLIMLSLILTLALIIVITLVSKKAFKPLNNLIKVIKNINKTNFDNKIKEYSNDEIGLLAMNFNYMIEEINASYQQLEAYNEEITVSFPH